MAFLPYQTNTFQRLNQLSEPTSQGEMVDVARDLLAAGAEYAWAGYSATSETHSLHLRSERAFNKYGDPTDYDQLFINRMRKTGAIVIGLESRQASRQDVPMIGSAAVKFSRMSYYWGTIHSYISPVGEFNVTDEDPLFKEFSMQFTRTLGQVGIRTNHRIRSAM